MCESRNFWRLVRRLIFFLSFEFLLLWRIRGFAFSVRVNLPWTGVPRFQDSILNRLYHTHPFPFVRFVWMTNVKRDGCRKEQQATNESEISRRRHRTDRGATLWQSRLNMIRVQCQYTQEAPRQGRKGRRHLIIIMMHLHWIGGNVGSRKCSRKQDLVFLVQSRADVRGREVGLVKHVRTHPKRHFRSQRKPSRFV